MKNILLVAKREYITQIRKKSFIIISLLAPLLLIISGLVTAFIIDYSKTQYKIVISDESGIFSEMENTNNLIFQYVYVNAINTVKETLPETNAIDGILTIPVLKDNNFTDLENFTRFFTNKNINISAQKELSNIMSNKILKLKAEELGLSEYQISDLNHKFILKPENVKNGDNSLIFSIKSYISGILMYATLMFIIIYGVRVMRSILEEKNNRIVEIIISSVKPFNLMLGKILGVTMIAITQFVTWIVMGIGLGLFFANKYPSMHIDNSENIDRLVNNTDIFLQISQISEALFSINYVTIIFVFIFYFILGYIFYSSIYAAIGSAVDNETETQQFTTFAVIPLMISLYGSVSIINNPESNLAFWFSIIPFTSPVSMIARIPFGVPIWQLITSALILLLSTFIMILLAGKIYRIGILMHGNKVNLREMWKWIKSQN